MEEEEREEVEKSRSNVRLVGWVLLVVLLLGVAWYFGPSSENQWNTGTGQQRSINRFFGIETSTTTPIAIHKFGQWVDRDSDREENWITVSGFNWRHRGMLISWNHGKVVFEFQNIDLFLQLMELEGLADIDHYRTLLSHLILDRIAADDGCHIVFRIQREFYSRLNDQAPGVDTIEEFEALWRQVEAEVERELKD